MNTTTRAQHTPGPWKVLDRAVNAREVANDVLGLRAISRDGICAIAYVPDAAQDDPDARLIAAAPALLGALEDILIYHGTKLPADLRDVAEYAIRQTRGEA